MANIVGSIWQAPYKVYISDEGNPLDYLMLGVTPERISINSRRNDKTAETAAHGEINILGRAALKRISFSSFIPSKFYEFDLNAPPSMVGVTAASILAAIGVLRFEPNDFIEKIEEWREARTPIVLTIPDRKIQLVGSIPEFSYELTPSGDYEYSIEVVEFRPIAPKYGGLF